MPSPKRPVLTTMETSSSSTSSSMSPATSSSAYDDELERGASLTPSQPKRPTIPWYVSTKFLALAAVLLMAGAGAGAAFALVNKGGSSNSSDSDSLNPNPSPPATTTSPPTVVSITSKPTTMPRSPTAPPTSAPSIATFEPTITSAPTLPVTYAPTVTASPTIPPTIIYSDEAFSFYVMGDIPYNQVQKALLATQVAEIRANPLQDAVVTVHVGDMMGHAANCAGSFIAEVADVLRDLPTPTLALAGDNDFLDCDDPSLAWDNHVNTFVGFEDYWLVSNRTLNVMRNVARPTHFSFVHNGILFISVDIWQGANGAVNEEVNVEWVTNRVEKFFSETTIRGVILFGHAQRERTIRPFFERIAALFYDEANAVYIREVPVMYIHGDGHEWSIGTAFAEQLGWDLFVDIQVDQGAKAPPIAIQVAQGSVGDANFVPLYPETSLQYVFGRGLFRIDRRSGRY